MVELIFFRFDFILTKDPYCDALIHGLSELITVFYTVLPFEIGCEWLVEFRFGFLLGTYIKIPKTAKTIPLVDGRQNPLQILL